METHIGKRPRQGVVTLAHAIIALGVCLVAIGLVAAWGAQSSLGPALFLAGSLVAVVGGAVRYDAVRRLSSYSPGDPQFRPDHSH
ncbi:hypothetical protein [Galactobacter valiniphilus]|uniref:hypothetical protein n=1 Tax=Galactobacter valiniphilus TaxID=2676122 RepID=UPI003735D5F1